MPHEIGTRGSDLRLKISNLIVMSTTYPPGTAPIKAQSVLHFLIWFSSIQHFFHGRYVISLQDRTLPDDDAAEGNTNRVSLCRPTEVDDDGQNTPGQGEKSRISGAQRRKPAQGKKKRRGQNKGRRFQKMRDELDLCWRVAAGEACEFGSECV